jgi:hypothetical protein
MKLAEYSKDIRNFTGSIWDATDAHFAHVAGYIKKSLPEGWLPERARPRPPPPAPHLIHSPYLYRLQDWVSRNRAITAAVIAFVGTGGFLVWRERKKYNRKRRAARASNGARREVVGKHKTDCLQESSTDSEKFSPALQTHPSSDLSP